MSSRTHYHIGANIPGYLPEGDVWTVRTKREAAEILLAEKERTLDSDSVFWEEEGSRRRRFEGRARDLFYYYVDREDPHDLGIVFWANPCTEEDCMRELADLAESGLF